MMNDSVDQFTELENSIAETVQQTQQEQKIYARAQELLHVDGSTYGYSQEKAREQATLEVLGAPTKCDNTKPVESK